MSVGFADDELLPGVKKDDTGVYRMEVAHSVDLRHDRIDPWSSHDNGKAVPAAPINYAADTPLSGMSIIPGPQGECILQDLASNSLGRKGIALADQDLRRQFSFDDEIVVLGTP